ncbi:hypothetical protein [Mucilaginibacter sp.]|uniref:hypothetical protein n=1 Tax=Mucilaginibacter sp. TaxID=1882438 RepID=UPI0025EBB5EC|nr:hypothetical protein [Mucilaginibacter sp.]
MKSIDSIRINGNDDEILSVSLQDILENIKDGQTLKWSLLWIYAVGDLGTNKNMLDFEEEVNSANNGIFFTWEELKSLSSKFEQVLEMVLIGVKDIKDLKRYESDELMYSICQYTIELIDSSYWEIHSLDISSLEQIKDNLPGVEYIEE